jgi:hypothetical protein
MVWLRMNLDSLAITAWCILTSDIGKPMMGLVGFGGLIATVRSLWIPVAESNIITLRNRQRRYRRITIIVGLVALFSFMSSIPMYAYSTSHLRAMGKVCEMSETPHAAATGVLPFLAATTFALILFGCFQARVFNMKNSSRAAQT